jgi:hypothetical protein
MPNQLVICDDAIVRQMGVIKDNILGSAALRLYKSNIAPAHGDVLGDYTPNEADFTGYGAATPSWTPVTISGSRAQSTGSPISWTKNGATGNTIYGYFLQRYAGSLIGARKFVSAIDMNDDGDNMTVQPICTLVDQAIKNAGSSSFVWCNGSLQEFADILIGAGDGLWACTLHLFKDSGLTPSRSDSASTYTASGVEADFSGYVAAGITWQADVLVADQVRIPADQTVWTKSGVTGNTIYGYFILDHLGRLVGAKKYDAPVAMTANGQQHTVQLVYTIESEL